MDDNWARRSPSEILYSYRHGLLEGDDCVVSCGSCTSCCESGLAICIDASEVETLNSIPQEQVVEILDLPYKHFHLEPVVGRCPMFLESHCTIYDTRPRACRQFDCRTIALTESQPPGETDSKLTNKIEDFLITDPWRDDEIGQVALQRARNIYQKQRAFFIALNIQESSADEVMAIVVLFGILRGEISEPSSDEEVLRDFLDQFRTWRAKRVREQRNLA